MDAVFLKWQAWFALIAAVNGYTFFNYSCPSTCSCHVIDITTNCSGQDISELPDKIYLGVRIEKEGPIIVTHDYCSVLSWDVSNENQKSTESCS